MRLSWSFRIIASAAIFFACLPAGVLQAGERGCTGQCYEEAPAPPIHRVFERRITYAPGVYEIDRVPPLYGWATRRVLLDSGVEWRERPAVYKTIKVRQRIRSRTLWEKRWVDGRYIMCKVRVPSKTFWVHKRVLVSPGKRWKVRAQPVYGYVKKRILLHQSKNIAIYHPPVQRYVREQVVIRPESTVWVPISKTQGDW
jgi:hypothetical protein